MLFCMLDMGARVFTGRVPLGIDVRGLIHGSLVSSAIIQESRSDYLLHFLSGFLVIKIGNLVVKNIDLCIL